MRENKERQKRKSQKTINDIYRIEMKEEREKKRERKKERERE